MMSVLPQAVSAEGAQVRIGDADITKLFETGLEYGAPARGCWNIVHTGMLLPQAHQIFVCAANCLRGVVLTAAEMQQSHRFSTVTIRENNVLDGDMEELIIDGVSDILQNKLPALPPAVLLYTSCIHHFMGCDMERVFGLLRQKFPSVGFSHAFMNPIMRKSGLTPDQLMRRQLYSLLQPMPKTENSVNIIGNDFALPQSSDIMQTLQDAGAQVRQIQDCTTFDEYLTMAQSTVNITTQPAANAAAQALEDRLQQKHLYLPQSFDFDEIDADLDKLTDTMGMGRTDTSLLREKALQALGEAKKEIGNMPVVIDYTLTSRPLGLAKLLLQNGFCVTTVYLDSVSGEEKEAFFLLQQNAPELKLNATMHPKMRVMPRGSSQKVLALGQKSAYFTASEYFVNLVEDAGLWGYDGIVRLAALMKQAVQQPKDTRRLIEAKGWGCASCL